jgi:hypothetical protein
MTDPLKHLPDTIVFGDLPSRPRINENCNGCTVVLEPGVYQGGIRLGGQAKAIMRPGRYVMKGGGLELGAQTQLYSVRVDGAITTSSPMTWGADCPDGSCGVLIFNTRGPGGSCNSMGAISIAAGATLKLRSLSEYEGVLMWQDIDCPPSPSYEQPVVTLSGGGSVDMHGTIYAPSARIFLRGGAGGSGGGGAIELPLRFVSYDLQFNGNSTFHFIYVADESSKPMDYGLVDPAGPGGGS